MKNHMKKITYTLLALIASTQATTFTGKGGKKKPNFEEKHPANHIAENTVPPLHLTDMIQYPEKVTLEDKLNILSSFAITINLQDQFISHIKKHIQSFSDQYLCEKKLTELRRIHNEEEKKSLSIKDTAFFLALLNNPEMFKHKDGYITLNSDVCNDPDMHDKYPSIVKEWEKSSSIKLQRLAKINLITMQSNTFRKEREQSMRPFIMAMRALFQNIQENSITSLQTKLFENSIQAKKTYDTMNSQWKKNNTDSFNPEDYEFFQNILAECNQYINQRNTINDLYKMLHKEKTTLIINAARKEKNTFEKKIIFKFKNAFGLYVLDDERKQIPEELPTIEQKKENPAQVNTVDHKAACKNPRKAKSKKKITGSKKKNGQRKKTKSYSRFDPNNIAEEVGLKEEEEEEEYSNTEGAKIAEKQAKDNTSTITFQDDRYNKKIVLFKSSHTQPVTIPTLPAYTNWVTAWFKNPEQAKIDQGYTIPDSFKFQFKDVAAFHHGFTQKADQHIFQLGRQHQEQSRRDTQRNDIVIVMPGGIQDNDTFTLGQFTYVIDTQTEQCFHRLFTSQNNFAEELLRNPEFRLSSEYKEKHLSQFK